MSKEINDIIEEKVNSVSMEWEKYLLLEAERFFEFLADRFSEIEFMRDSWFVRNENETEYYWDGIKTFTSTISLTKGIIQFSTIRYYEQAFENLRR